MIRITLRSDPIGFAGIEQRADGRTQELGHPAALPIGSAGRPKSAFRKGMSSANAYPSSAAPMKIEDDVARHAPRVGTQEQG